MSASDRRRPVVHDADLGVAVSAAWLRRRLASGRPLAVTTFHQGMDPQVTDGEALLVEGSTETKGLVAGDVLVVDDAGAARLVRLIGRDGGRFATKPDAASRTQAVDASAIVGRVTQAGRFRAWRFTSRWLPWFHAAWGALRRHRRHYLGTADAAKRSVEQRYSDPANIEGYRRKGTPGLLPVEQRLVDAHFPAAGRILVGGCAAGRVNVAMAGRGWKAVGVDVVPGMLDAARELSAAAGLVEGREVSWTLGDIEALPESLGTFEAAWLGHFVHGNVPGRARRVAMLKGIAARLVPGGALVISVRRYRSPWHWLAINAPLLVSGGQLREAGDFAGQDARGDWTDQYFYYHFFTRAELARELEAAGFECLEQDGAFAAARRRAEGSR